MSHRVVFDTNVLFSAVGWGGTPGRCVEFVKAGRIRGITCPEILDELATNLTAKLQYSDSEIDTVLAALLSIFEVVRISGDFMGPQAHRGDDKVLECSLVGEATHIVTGDRRHLLPLKRFAHAEIVTPSQLLEIVERAPV
ncbi:MAG TPA: putative toxin-antitoxin system toxin component, PIN family [Phycisphaerae bacterium]|nr:putative toxin-antitoxin system toxin component, PIN family [Phycisphaerae bacterium]